MIHYHVIGLLCLVGAAISAIEALAAYMQHGPSSGQFWLMVGTFVLAIAVYLRARKLRKQHLHNPKK